MSGQLYLGVDMGGTGIKLAVVDSKGTIIDSAVVPTDILASPLSVVKVIVESSSKLKNYNKVKSIGVGIAGDIDSIKGVVRYSPNLPKWRNIALKSLLEKYSKKKVYVDNDANTAAIGAFWLDTKGKANDLVCITLGTGIGGGLIVNKKLYRGASLSAGEIGHISIEATSGAKCNCGNCGCPEAYLGAKYLSRYAAAFAKKNKSKIIETLVNKDYSKITPEILYKAAIKKDKVALQIWDYAGKKLGILLATVLNFMNPDTIILCGGLSQSGKVLLNPALQEMKKRAFKAPQNVCKISNSKYTSQLGVVGAAMLARQ